MMKKTAAYLLLFCTLLLFACSGDGGQALPTQGNAAYYWRTAFTLDSTERAFLSDYAIQRLYCRYFDVVLSNEQMPEPNATLRFLESPPDSLELVPSVFIMNDCMQPSVLTSSDGEEDVATLAQKIVRRIVQMNETHDIQGVREIQIDCDYTARNRSLYYRFLTEARREAAAHGLLLSVTIRLHQLSMPAPPTDYGILMLYNTGDPERFAERNPILDLRDVQPYLTNLSDYPLPLGAAYPTFLWNRQIHGVDISHMADFQTILQVKHLVEARRSDLRALVLTYHLDSQNIHRYTPKQYEEIYRH